eukprot:CAMPEP_0181129786 /NCGR_PEP_ID=MMETSP1071-20121207/29510_1 /TAXON_ID=35127 /ORGANISM="Thalassiosira sp., Strain NH16" /LENGTH=870 /DNA_ID=CAMNT_0023215801 /DNA_START=337 /DNA_END=2946 /DNA_ORIENTATION=+
MSSEHRIPAAAGHQQQTDPSENGDPTLFSRLRSQVEFYFSLQNLARDAYLQNMLTSDHPDMPTPRPATFMCPVGVITSFPKVRDICAQSTLSDQPVAILMAKALEESNVVTLSENWIGPSNQQLPPPANMMGGHMGAAAMTGQLPPRGPQYQMHLPYQQGSQGYTMNPIQGIAQGMMMVPPPPPPPVQQQGGQHGVMIQQHQLGMPYSMGPTQGQLNAASLGSRSPSSASLESTPSLQKQKQQPLSLQQKQQQTIDKLDASASSKFSVGEASVASLSSVSLPGVTGPMQQGVPVMGQQGGAYLIPTGPSPPPTMQLQPMQQSYPMGPLMQQQMAPGMPALPPTSLPGGMQQPYPYYNPQMTHQIVYPPGNYMPQPMQQQQVQGGLMQGQPQMQQAYPSHPYMGYGGMHPPPPHSYPTTGPPPPYPYQGMQQYMDAYGGQGQQGGNFHGYPSKLHSRQFNDNRHNRVGSPGFHGDHHGSKKKSDKKKKQNTNQQGQLQHHQQHKRDSYESGSTGDNNGQGQQQRRINEYSRNDHSSSPPFGEHNRGGKFWKKQHPHNQPRGSGEQSRRHGNNVSPAFNSSRYNNRDKHNNRLSSSDATSSRQYRTKEDENRDIFTTSDFPGLGGGLRGEIGDDGDGDDMEKSVRQANVGCYASALLKKKELAGDISADGNEALLKNDNVELAATGKPNDIDSHTRQTEEMEKEILSEFHDLSLIGNVQEEKDDNDANVIQVRPNDTTDDETEGCQQTVGTASSSTIDASLRSAQPATNHTLPILPAGPFENETADLSPDSIPPLMKPEPPFIDVTNSDDFPNDLPSRESKDIDCAVVPSSPLNATAEKEPSVPKEDPSQPPVVSNDDRIHAVENSKPSGAW